MGNEDDVRIESKFIMTRYVSLKNRDHSSILIFWVTGPFDFECFFKKIYNQLSIIFCHLFRKLTTFYKTSMESFRLSNAYCQQINTVIRIVIPVKMFLHAVRTCS